MAAHEMRIEKERRAEWKCGGKSIRQKLLNDIHAKPKCVRERDRNNADDDDDNDSDNEIHAKMVNFLWMQQHGGMVINHSKFECHTSKIFSFGFDWVRIRLVFFVVHGKNRDADSSIYYADCAKQQHHCINHWHHLQINEMFHFYRIFFPLSVPQHRTVHAHFIYQHQINRQFRSEWIVTNSTSISAVVFDDYDVIN